jgi:peptidylprolyl isomerase
MPLRHPEHQQESGQMAGKFLNIELKDGSVKIEMLPDVAPAHVEQITALAEKGAYDGVAFHRVIDGFMAQTGDVQHGVVGEDGTCSSRAGTGGSDLGNIKAEFSKLPFDRGVCGMARAQMPDSANSQFFIMFKDGHFLNNNYTVWGRVTEGMEHVDDITRGEPPANPDKMIKVTVSED